MSDKKLRFGVAGVGGVGQGHVSAILASEYAILTALCDPLGEKIHEERAARKMPPIGIEGLPVFTDFDAFISSGLLDCIVISAPDALHCRYTVTALEHGIDVLCEKPLTVTDEESAAIMDAVRRTGRKAYAGQICRFAPAFVKARELLDAGTIGELFCVEAMYCHGCHKDLPKDNWRFFPPRHATSCGGCHAIDILRYFAGDPDTVFAFGNRKCRTDWSVEDCSETVLKFPDGTVGRVLTTLGVIAPYSMQTSLYGTAGTIFTNNVANEVVVHTAAGKTVYPVEVNTHNSRAEIDLMCRSILYGDPVCHDIIEGAKTLVVCNAAIRSIGSGMPEKPDYACLA